MNDKGRKPAVFYRDPLLAGAELMIKPHELLEKFGDYYDWCNDNPLYESKLIPKTGEIIEVPLKRVMTIHAFCLYCGIATGTFFQYSKDVRFARICEMIKDAIYVDKFEGAAVNIYNSAFMMRELGMHDTVNHNLSDRRKSVDELFPKVEDIEAIDVKETSIEEVEKINNNDRK